MTTPRTGSTAGRVGVAVALTIACSALTLVATVAPAAAAVFSNTNSINMPDADCTDPDKAVPYPSNIVVSGTSGTITDVNVSLNGVTHPFEGDIDILLVAPGGTNLQVLSDAGTGPLLNANVVFDDAAGAQAPQNSAWGAGTYKPSNYTELSGADVFPAPAPVPSANTTLAAFNGANANGTWSLYVMDDACPDAGAINGGWALNITTAALTATSTAVNSSLNPSRTGNTVTFTATVTSGGPVTTGSVTFTEGATTLAANVAVNGAGVATFNTSTLAEGNHIITATYNANATFATSSGSVNQRVDNNTTVTGSTYCNTGPIALNDNTIATPYPSNIFVAGAPTNVIKVTATLKNVTHGFDGDIEALLVGPAGQNLVAVSDAGTAGITNVTVNLDDAAASFLPVAGAWAAPNSTISAKPTNYNEATPDSFPAPAPAASGATALSTFNGSNPNGTWSLYVKDDGAPDTGTIAGGWCLNFTFDTTPPSVTINQAGGQADPTNTSPINFTAIFSEPVTGFNNTDVTITGAAGGPKAVVVTGGPSTYNVAVSGMTTFGTVIATIPAGGASDSSGNLNTASTSADNTVTWDATVPACAYARMAGPPKRVDFTVQDVGSGIRTIVVTTATNIVTPVPIPAFVMGTAAPISFSATKNNQAQASAVAIVITDMAGNQSSCV